MGLSAGAVSITARICTVAAIAGVAFWQPAEAKLPHGRAAKTLHLSAVLLDQDKCTIAVYAKSFTMPEDEKALKAELKPFASKYRQAEISGDIDTPWRCIGGAIYAMQSLGFRKVGFVSHPRPEPR